MGVLGVGKLLIGEMLVECLLCSYIDGDVFYSVVNKEKMYYGILLIDEDCWLWLCMICVVIEEK